MYAVRWDLLPAIIPYTDEGFENMSFMIFLGATTMALPCLELGAPEICFQPVIDHENEGRARGGSEDRDTAATIHSLQSSLLP